MNIESTKPNLADPADPGAIEETTEQGASQRVGEGIGVFRGILLTFLFYLAVGSLIWFLWHALTQRPGH